MGRGQGRGGEPNARATARVQHKSYNPITTTDDNGDGRTTGSPSIYRAGSARNHFDPVANKWFWLGAVLAALAGVWAGLTMVAISYPSPNWYKGNARAPGRYTAAEVINYPARFLPPFGRTGVDVEGKSVLPDTRNGRPGRYWSGTYAEDGSLQDRVVYQSMSLALAGCAVVAVSFVVLTIASKRLAPLRDELITRPLQRLPQGVSAKGGSSMFCLTYGEMLRNAFLVLITAYWLVPNPRCRMRCESTPRNMTAEQRATFRPACAEACTRFPWPLGDGQMRHFAHHLGSVSGDAMALAMVPTDEGCAVTTTHPHLL